MRDLGPGELVFWKGLQLVRRYECPNCGLEARDMMDYTTVPMSCPVCKTKWDRIVSTTQASLLTGG